MASESVLITEQEHGLRLDQVLTARLPGFSRSQVQKLIEAGVVSGPGAGKSKNPVKRGETYLVLLPDSQAPLRTAAGSLPILYEDRWLIVIDKPAGIVVHPNTPEQTGSAIQMVLAERPEIGLAVYDSDSPLSRLRPGIVHRLDKDTSGALVIAKTELALRALAEQFRHHTVIKWYRTLLSGRLDQEVEVDAAIGRKPGSNRMSVMADPEQGREAISLFSPLLTVDVAGLPLTEAACSIRTGRTHQIRVHAKSLGAPVLGDERYASKRSAKASELLRVPRQMLHAENLELRHPETGETVRFSSPLPDDFRSVLSRALTGADAAC